MSDYEDTVFYGIDGEEAEGFIRMVRKRALVEGKQRDNEWIADFAGLCFAGDALRWYERQADETQLDWSKLRRAILDSWPNTAPRQGTARGFPSGFSSPAPAAAAAAPSPLETPIAAPAPPQTFSFSPNASFSFSGNDKTVPFHEGYIEIFGTSGESMGYLSRVLDADDTYPRTKSKSLALRVKLAVLPERHTIRVLGHTGSDNFLGITWRNLGASEWSVSSRYTAALLPIRFVPSESKWKSSNNQDKGATQHHIWTLARDNSLQADFVDNNGGMHRLHVVASKVERVRFVRDLETFLKGDSSYSAARLVFVPDD